MRQIGISIIIILAFFYLIVGIGSCMMLLPEKKEVSKIPTDSISLLMPMLTTLEDQARHSIMLIQIAMTTGRVNEPAQKKLKAHFDIYEVLHLTAYVYLVENRETEYKSTIITAAAELDKIDKLLGEIMSERKSSKSEF